MKVALITNYNIGEKSSAAMAVAERLQVHNCRIVVPLTYKDRIERMYRKRPNLVFDTPANIYESANLIIVLGGDGSIMEAARNAAARGTPVLGINMGRVGYLAELEMNELDLLDKVMEGQYTLDKRTMLNAEVISATGKETKTAFALNDAVISNGSISRIIDLQLSESGVPINTYRADGLIISTPTGSTAYSMSAGGPIADPRISCFCVTPICPHMSLTRSILFPDSASIEVKNTCRREKVLYLTLDGRSNFELMRNDVVRITKSELTASIVRVKERSFYDKLRQRNNGRGL
jgi:NAD+ kinase